MQQAEQQQYLDVKVEDFQNDGNYTFKISYNQKNSVCLSNLGNKGIIIHEKLIIPKYDENIKAVKTNRKLYLFHQKNKFYTPYQYTFGKVIEIHAMNMAEKPYKIYYQNEEFLGSKSFEKSFENEIKLIELFFLTKENQNTLVCIYSNTGLTDIEFQNHPIITRPQILKIQLINNNDAGKLIDKIFEGDGNLQNKKFGCLSKFGILNQFDTFEQLGLKSGFISIVIIPVPDFNQIVQAQTVLVRFFTLYECKSQDIYPLQTKIRNTIDCQKYILLISGKVVKNIDAYLQDFLTLNDQELNITLFEIYTLKQQLPQQNDPLYLDIIYKSFLHNINQQLPEQKYLEIQNLNNICPFKDNFDMKYYDNANFENLFLIHFKNKFYQILNNENKNSSVQAHAEQQVQDQNVAVYFKNQEIKELKEKTFLEAFPNQKLTELYVFKREINKIFVCIYHNTQIKQIDQIFRPKLLYIESIDRNCSVKSFSEQFNLPYFFLSKFGVLNVNDKFDELFQKSEICHLILLPIPEQESPTQPSYQEVYVLFWEFGQPYKNGEKNGYFSPNHQMQYLLDNNQEFLFVIYGEIVNELDAQLGQFVSNNTFELNITLVKKVATFREIKESVRNQPIFAELLLYSFAKDVLQMKDASQVNALSPVFKVDLQANNYQ